MDSLLLPSRLFSVAAFCSIKSTGNNICEGDRQRDSYRDGHEDCVLAENFSHLLHFFLDPALRLAPVLVVPFCRPSPALKTQKRNHQRLNRNLMIPLLKHLHPRQLLRTLVMPKPSEMKRRGSGRGERRRESERRRKRKRGSGRRKRKRNGSGNGSGRSKNRRSRRRRESPRRRTKGSMRMGGRKRLKLSSS